MVRYLLACGAVYEPKERILREAMFYGDNQDKLVFEIISGLHKGHVKEEMEQVCSVTHH